MNDPRPDPDQFPTPHPGQDAILNLPARYRVAVCGRRFGKTVAGAIAAVRKCELSQTRQRIWWIAPIRRQATRVEKDVAAWLTSRMKTSRKKEDIDTAKESGQWQHRRGEHALIYLRNNSSIEFHTAYAPDNLRGAGLDLVIVDEAADVSEYAWTQVIRPMLLEARGEAIIIGTPKGTQNWLHRIYLYGQSDDQPLYGSIRLPSSANPLLPADELDGHRADCTPDEYRQEFEAEFIDGVNAIFPNIAQSIKGLPLKTGRPSHKYITGIDLGRAKDYTVLCSLNCRERHVEGFDRFNKLDWSAQLQRINNHLKRFPGPCVVDATGIGDPIYEQIAKTNRHAERFIFTETSRANIINGLGLAFANNSILLSEIPDLIHELQSFGITEEPIARRTRRPRYGPAGDLHDDCVMSLAMAWWGLECRGLWAATTTNPYRDGLFA